VLTGKPPLLATLFGWFRNCHNKGTCHGNIISYSCPFCRVTQHGSFIASKASVVRDMLRQLRCFGTR
jgi:hypothetical protein